MIFARLIGADRPADLPLAFVRLGLPRSAQEYLGEKLPQAHLLLTGLSEHERRFLKHLPEQSMAPGKELFPSYVPGDAAKRPGTALLSGRQEQFERLLVKAGEASPLSELQESLEKALSSNAEPAPMQLGSRRFDFGKSPYLMGIVNVTPDSFSDGGKYLDVEKAVAHGRLLWEQGADVLDVGGESTRPGAAPVSAEEEKGRVVPVIQGLVAACPGVPVSVDTMKSEVAAAALEAGAVMVNDVSGLRFDSNMAQVVAAAKACLCVMHMQGTPRTMQQNPRYHDVVEEVFWALHESVSKALAAGIARERVMVDPGIGFGKLLPHNLMLLRRLCDFRQLGVPILLGTSRKSFIGQLTGGKPPAQRLAGTLASMVWASAQRGADFLRVHDVGEVKDALLVAEAIGGVLDGGEAFGPR